MKKQTFTFSVAGVTMEGRQNILKALRGACITATVTMPGPPKVGDRGPHFDAALRRVKIKLAKDPKNKFDDDAIKVLVYSNKKKKWFCIGFVPKKYRLKYKDKSVPLNRVVGLIMKGKRLRRTYIHELSHFEDEGKTVYYCKVTIEFDEVKAPSEG